MNIYKSEKQDFKSKDELLKEVIRDRFDECTNDFSGDLEAIDLIDLAIHYGYADLAKEMRNDFNAGAPERQWFKRDKIDPMFKPSES